MCSLLKPQLAKYQDFPNTHQCGCVSLARDSAHQKKTLNINFHDSSEDAYSQRFPDWTHITSRSNLPEALDIPSTQNRFRVEMFRLPFFAIGRIQKKTWGQDSNLAKQAFPCNKIWVFRNKTGRC